jgi:predicted ATPase
MRQWLMTSGRKVPGTPRGNEHGAALARPGRAERSSRALAPVYGWFTEGFDTLDLKEAKTLLDELAAKGAT